ncbi:MAG: UvrD-helicase domain-containing protein [Halanaerobiales bacterium]
MIDLNKEKKEILEQEGNVLVTANPGTGKTLLLSHKYVDLLEDNTPEDILCLTFTRKARREMEERIIDLIKEKEMDIDISKINIHTFHSFALESLGDVDIVSSNRLRYIIYDYLRENEIFNYSNSYLVDKIVPKIENLIRYIKSFGIKPEDINKEEAKKFLDPKRFTKEQLSNFLEEFTNIYEIYERGEELDHNDLLLNFLKINNSPKFKYVLVDELQDVNKIEAKIALNSAENFFAVGDQKQAIFGFQGGSILNFKLFEESKQEVLSENFRSTNEILDYSKNYFVSKIAEEEYEKSLENLENKHVDEGEKVKIISEKEDKESIACSLANKLSKKGQVAIIARTNGQLMELSKKLDDRGIDHSSTYFSGSKEAKSEIIKYIRSLISEDFDVIKNGLFTCFSPVCLREAFNVDNLGELNENFPEFKELRDNTNNLHDLGQLFEKRIIPVCISYGEEYLLAALTVRDSLQEGLDVLKDKNLEELTNYLKSSDLEANESNIEKDIVLTTVHKAKGKEFDNVIYVPKKPRDNSNFVDRVVEAILKSEGINADEELEEESIRLDFVAFTRAKKKLYIIGGEKYLNDNSELMQIDTIEEDNNSFYEDKRRAYNLFVNGKYDKAKELLESEDKWIINFIKEYFEDLDSISFSRLEKDPYKYLVNNILSLRESSKALEKGKDVHNKAEKLVKGEKISKSEYPKYIDNVRDLISEVKEKYPDIINSEKIFEVPLNSIMDTDSDISFRGKIDAIFKNGERYLILDWKTSSSDSRGSKYRRQLELYRRAYSQDEDVDTDKIEVGIGYVGLKDRINDGKVKKKLDLRQPSSSSFNTVKKRMDLILKWKENPESFLKDLAESNKETPLLRAILNQYEKEKD